MSSLINKIKEKTAGHSSSQKSGSEQHQQPQQRNDEPTYSIQPHPAKSEDPRDLEPPQLGGGLNSNPEYGAFHARDPHVPSPEVLSTIREPAATREELHARQEELNRR